MSASHPVVFDCNVFLQAMLNSHGAAGACWQRAVAGDLKLFVSAQILSEVRRLPEHRALRRFRNFSSDRVERFIEEILEIAIFVAEPPKVFAYSRDPNDAHYIDVAIATGALLVVSNDKDLLDLMNDSNQEGKGLRSRYPALRILTPP